MKLPQLTFTRFLAAMAIVIFHDACASFPFYYGSAKYFIYFFNCLVSYFFVLSGFILIISSHINGKLTLEKKSFWFNRFSRIYPLYIFALIFYLALTLSVPKPNVFLTWNEFFLSAGLLQAWFPGYAMAYNYPAWSLSVEAFFYLCFPLLVYLFDKIRLKNILLTGSVLWITSLAIYIYVTRSGMPLTFTLYFPLLHLNDFIIGICTGYLLLYKNEYLATNKNYLYSLLFIGTVSLIILVVYHNHFVHSYYHDGLLAPLFAVFILSLSVDKGNVNKLFNNRYAIYLGEISYAIYILQLPFKILITAIDKRTFHLSHTAEFYAYMVCLILFSAACFELIEKPSRIWLRKKYSAAQQRATNS